MTQSSGDENEGNSLPLRPRARAEREKIRDAYESRQTVRARERTGTGTDAGTRMHQLFAVILDRDSSVASLIWLARKEMALATTTTIDSQWQLFAVCVCISAPTASWLASIIDVGSMIF